jgi:hypothetical protein
MQTLEYSSSGTQTFAIWPETNAQYAPDSGSYLLQITNDYDGSVERRIPLTLLNTPTVVTPRLVFSIQRASIPQYTGFYTTVIQEGLRKDLKWGLADNTWSEIPERWSATYFTGELTVLDNDRAWVSGSDVPSFTQYTSPSETGAYTTYHG